MPVPVGPGAMNMHSHQRRESTQSAHADSGHPHMNHGGRGGMSGGGRGGRHPQSYGPNNHQYNQQSQYNNGYGRGAYSGPNQARGQPPNMNNQQYQGSVQAYNPNSPRMVHRSPAMAHASPALATVQPMATPQLYPPNYMQPAPHGVSYILFILPFYLLVSFYLAIIATNSLLSGKLENRNSILKNICLTISAVWITSISPLRPERILPASIFGL